MTTLLGALIDLSGRQHILHWGRLTISLANLMVIAVMLGLFVLVIFLPHPRRTRRAGRR